MAPTKKEYKEHHTIDIDMSFPLFVRELMSSILQDNRCVNVVIEMSSYESDNCAKITIECDKLRDHERQEIEETVLEMREDFGFGILESVQFVGHGPTIILMCKKCQ